MFGACVGFVLFFQVLEVSLSLLCGVSVLP